MLVRLYLRERVQLLVAQAEGTVTNNSGRGYTYWSVRQRVLLLVGQAEGTVTSNSGRGYTYL